MALWEVAENLTVTIVVIGILILNGVSLTAIVRSRPIREEILTPLTYSVFTADLVQGVFLGLISTYLSWAGITNPPLWVVRVQALGGVGNLGNICSLTFLSLWQTVGIIKPLQFSTLATRTRIWTSVLLAWLWALIVMALRMVSDEIFYNSTNRYVQGYFLNP